MAWRFQFPDINLHADHYDQAPFTTAHTMAAPNKKIFIVGGTGAQGIPVVKGQSKSPDISTFLLQANAIPALTKDGEYSVRILTRDPDSFRAQKIAKLANVELQQGQLDRDEDLRRGFKGCWGAWINIDGFVVGQKNELFWGIRGYQLAQEAGIKFFVWANLDYSLRDANYDPQIHCGHYDTKSAVGSFILSESKWHEQRQKEDPKRDASYMGAALFTTGPYLDMCLSAYTPMAPSVAADGVVEWAVPLGKDGAVPHIALEDCGKYVRWLFDHAFDEHGKPGRAAGMDLAVATDHVQYDDLAAAFTQVTGKPARFVDISEEKYFLSRPERLHKFGLEHSNISPEGKHFSSVITGLSQTFASSPDRI